MTSGFDKREVIQRLLREGLAGFIQKPYKLHDLVARLQDILE